MSVEQISLRDARRLAVRAQLLDGQPVLPEGKEGVARAIEHLGHVQIDTIAVVERAHHQALWARRPDYDAEALHDLQAIDRRIFEYWTHAMSFVPICDYRFYVPRMNRIRREGTTWLRGWREKNEDVLADVLERVRGEGPLTSKDFAPPPGERRGTWWDWKPAKTALEILLWQGDLMVSERRNFQKAYDLTERVLPPGADATIPGADELARFQIRRSLSGLGVADAREIARLYHVVDREAVEGALPKLVRSGEIVEVAVDGAAGRYVLAGSLESGIPGDLASGRVALLSPFDGLILQRDRTKWLFDFDYTLECYVPEKKRKYGYFVFPILFGDALVGRLDPKADRKTKTLAIRKLLFEPSFDRFDELLPTFAQTLARFARFNGCEAVTFDVIRPAGHKRSLKSLVRRALTEEDRG